MSAARVMIVEDEFIVANHLRSCLENMGYSVSSSVPSGEEAIARIGKEQPDLVLMDIVLEGTIDGVEAAERIKRSYQIPVVFLTAYADADTLKRAKATEPFAFLVKPFREAELHTTIEVSLYKGLLDRKLRESEHRFRELAENIDEVFWTISLNDVAKSYISPIFEKIWGQPFTQVRSDVGFWIDTIHADDRPFAMEFRKKLKNGTVFQDEIEYRILHKSGEYRWIRERAFAVSDKKGNVIRLAGICNDITHRVKADQQREQLIRELTDALKRVETLHGLLSICASCKKIRDDKGDWRDLERYIKEHSKAEFSHCLCPECAQRLYPEVYASRKKPSS